MAAKKPKSDGKIKPKSKRGGRRAGAGRKPKQATVVRSEVSALVNGDPNEAVDLEVAFKALAPKCVVNLSILANGGYERVERTYQPAGLVLVEDFARNAKGEILTNAKGDPIKIDRRLYPDKPVDELVLVEQSISYAEPDRQANQYIVDRVLGKPRQAVELTDGETVKDIVAEAEARAAAHRPAERPDGV